MVDVVGVVAMGKQSEGINGVVNCCRSLAHSCLCPKVQSIRWHCEKRKSNRSELTL